MLELERIHSKIIYFLTQEPVLTICITDASSIGYGAILLHTMNNKRHVVEYFSKCTSLESKYHSYELETLVVVNTIKFTGA